MTRSESIFKNFQNQIVNGVHKIVKNVGATLPNNLHLDFAELGYFKIKHLLFPLAEM